MNRAFNTSTGAHVNGCTSVVARAARWAVEIIGAELVQDRLGERVAFDPHVRHTNDDIPE